MASIYAAMVGYLVWTTWAAGGTAAVATGDKMIAAVVAGMLEAAIGLTLAQLLFGAPGAWRTWWSSVAFLGTLGSVLNVLLIALVDAHLTLNTHWDPFTRALVATHRRLYVAVYGPLMAGAALWTVRTWYRQPSSWRMAAFWALVMLVYVGIPLPTGR